MPSQRETGVVLVVDDDPFSLELVSGVLEAAGHRCLLASNGEDALALAGSEPPELLLLDVVMPGMDGFELYAALQQVDGLADVPALFFSERGDLERMVRGFEAGARDYVTKPVRGPELLARVERHLQLHRERLGLDARWAREFADAAGDLLRVQQVAGIGTWKLEFPSERLTWSTQTYELFGIEPGSEVDLDIFRACLHPDDAEEVMVAWQRAVSEGSYDLEHRIVVGGRVRWVEEHAVFESDDHGTPLRALGTVRDVTERRRYQTLLEEDRARLRTAIDGAQAATWEWDLVHDDVRFSDRLAGFLGLPPGLPAQGTGSDVTAAIHPDDRARVAAEVGDHLAGTSDLMRLEFRHRRADGSWVWLRASGRVIRRTPDGAPELLAGICIDVTSERERDARLEHATSHDLATGLPNRARFTTTLADELATCTASGGRLLVACIDLDAFDLVNRIHGRERGDEVLLEVAERLFEFVDEDDHVGRIGGDEFGLVLRSCGDEDQTGQLGEELLRVLAAPYAGAEVALTASVGFTVFPQAQALDAGELLRQADQAMYHAKLAGKNRVHVFDLAGYDERREHYRRVAELRAGLAMEQLRLHYQPKVHLRTGDLLGFEALIRWQHPELGLLEPAAFLRMLEGDPVLLEVGDWVIESALADLERWRLLGLSTTVSVNIDRVQLEDPAFVSRLHHQLAAQPTVSPQQLEVEILETSVVSDVVSMSTVLAEVRALGVAVSLDDFGTGFSSLTFLKRLPAQTIKIDRSFVHGLLDDPEQAVIVGSIVGLGRSFGREVLAEGVETAEQARVLLELGCELGQGYGIARPMPGDEVARWAAGWRLPNAWRTAQPPCAYLSAARAELEHRSCLRELARNLEDPWGTPSGPVTEACPYTAWFSEAERAGCIRDEVAFARARRLHEEFHTVMDGAVLLHVAGRGEEALAVLPDLERLEEALVAEVQASTGQARPARVPGPTRDEHGAGSGGS